LFPPFCSYTPPHPDILLPWIYFPRCSFFFNMTKVKKRRNVSNRRMMHV
jgi:hypothetical protein